MMTTYKINGHHIYTLEQLLPFLYRFRIGLGRWHYAFNGPWCQEQCDYAVERVIEVAKKV
jgi:hypothetical protein